MLYMNKISSLLSERYEKYRTASVIGLIAEGPLHK